MGFHGRAAAHKLNITLHNGLSCVKLSTIGIWSSGNAFSGVMNDASPSGSPMDKSGFGRCLADARRTLPAPIHSANCKVRWGRNNGLGLFFMVRARPLSSSEGKSKCYSIQ